MHIDIFTWLQSFADTEKKLVPIEQMNQAGVLHLLHHLGNPHTRYPVIMVAGTKGKGSTAAMIEAILRASGLRVALYTTPHLHSVRERWQINRQPVSEEDMAAALTTVRDALTRYLPDTPLSIYEISTTAAFVYFAQQQVDSAVLEIGLGGRHDTVNLAPAILSVITSISLDHTHILGTTLGEIASHKAGIIKHSTPVITAPQHADALEVIADEAAKQEAPLIFARETGLEMPPTRTLHAYPVAITPDTVALKGSYQLENARLAVGAALLLQDQGYAIEAGAMAHGLATVHWPARLEVLQTQPLIVVDGAHNDDSIRKLLANLRQLFRYEHLIVIFGTSDDKDITGLAALIAPVASYIILTTSSHARAAPLAMLYAAIAPYAKKPLVFAPTMHEAMMHARELARPTDMICITGSLFIAAAGRELNKAYD